MPRTGTHAFLTQWSIYKTNTNKTYKTNTNKTYGNSKFVYNLKVYYYKYEV